MIVVATIVVVGGYFRLQRLWLCLVWVPFSVNHGSFVNIQYLFLFGGLVGSDFNGCDCVLPQLGSVRFWLTMVPLQTFVICDGCGCALRRVGRLVETVAARVIGVNAVLHG